MLAMAFSAFSFILWVLRYWSSCLAESGKICLAFLSSLMKRLSLCSSGGLKVLFVLLTAA